jgi:hypothetical protein
MPTVVKPPKAARDGFSTLQGGGVTISMTNGCQILSFWKTVSTANARLPHDVGTRAFRAARWQARSYSSIRRRSRVSKTPIDLRPR